MSAYVCSLFRSLHLPIGLCLAFAVGCGASARAAELQEETLEAWKRYERLTEQRIASELQPEGRFLVQEFFSAEEQSECNREVEADRVCVQQMRTLAPDGEKIDVPKGLIHHWMGSVRVPNADLDGLVAWVQDYDEHERYFDELEESRLSSRDGGAMQVFMRLKRKKIVTVYYHAEFDIFYSRHGPGRISSQGRATRLAELDDAGTEKEREKSPGRDSGYLWRLNSYWRFLADGKDVVVSCESVSLSRSVPPLVGPLIRGFVSSVPRESLQSTLTSVRDGFAQASSRSASSQEQGVAATE